MKLSIIILNHNTKDLLIQTIKSIKTKISHEIIVVDNASTDNSVKAVKKTFPQIKLIELKQNIGFASGNNVGIKQAKGEYVLLLNSDTQIVGSALATTIKFLDQNQKVGIATPKLVFPDGSLDLACHRGFPTLFNSLSYFLGLEKLFSKTKFFSGYHQLYKNLDTTHQVDVVSGAAMFIRAQIFDQIGFLDEQFFMYAEDIDFCLRAKKANWLTFYLHKPRIIHYKGASGSKSRHIPTKSTTRHHFYQTMYQYFEKHHGHKHPKPVKFMLKLALNILKLIRK